MFLSHLFDQVFLIYFYDFKENVIVFGHLSLKPVVSNADHMSAARDNNLF